MYLILGFLEALIEPTVTRQWAPSPTWFCAQAADLVRASHLMVPGGTHGPNRDPTVVLNPPLLLCAGCGLGACISFWAFWEHPLRQPQPDGAPIPLRFCAQAADLVHVSHLKLPRGTH